MICASCEKSTGHFFIHTNGVLATHCTRYTIKMRVSAISDISCSAFVKLCSDDEGILHAKMFVNKLKDFEVMG